MGAENEGTNHEVGLAINALGAECVTAIEGENQQLAFTLMLIDDIIKYGKMANWRPIRSIVNDLTDGAVIGELTESVPPKSAFYRRAAVVRDLVNRLENGRVDGFFSNQDSLVTAYNVLKQRLDDNMFFLEMQS